MNELRNIAGNDRRSAYLRRRKTEFIRIRVFRIAVLILLLVLWEVLTRSGILNPFVFSSPSRILATAKDLSVSGALCRHVGTSVLETISGFASGTILGILIAVVLWWSPAVSKVLDPYLVVLNALPKTALGPVFIVCIGTGAGAIIAMTLAISLIVTILNVLNGFNQTDAEKVRLMRMLGANRLQIFRKLVLPANLSTIVNALKINVGLSWVGVITGEFLVSRAGLGYLIVYGSQVFKMDLVMTSVAVLAVCAMIMHAGIMLIERATRTRFGGS